MAQPTPLSQVFLPPEALHPSMWTGIYQSLCAGGSTPVSPYFLASGGLIGAGLLILGAIALWRGYVDRGLTHWQQIQASLQHANTELQREIHDRQQAEVALQQLNQELEARVQQSTDALQQSEERFRQLTETIQEVFWLFDPIHHQNLYVSPAYERIWGQPLDTVYQSAWSWVDAIHPDDRDRILTLFASDSSWEHEAEYRIIRPDGAVRWIRDRSFPIRDTENQVYRVVGIAEDITERKQTEGELQQTRNFLKVVIDYLPVAVFVKDGRADHFGEMLLWNQTSEQMFGLTAEQAIGKTVQDYFPKEQANFFEQKDREAFERGTPEDIPEEPIDSYSLGRRILHTVKVPLYDDHQQPEYLLCFSEDITERKQAENAVRESERRLSTLISNLPGYIYRVANDPDYTPEFISEGVFAVTGYCPDEYLVDRTISCGQEIHPDDAESIWEIVQQAVANKQPYQCEYRIITKSGDQKWVWERGRGVYSDHGELICLEGFVTNITERKQVEEALRESEARWQFALEGAGDGVWDWNAQMHTVFYSQQWKAMLGYADHEVGNGREEWDSRLHPDDKAQCYADLNRHFSGETSTYQNEHRVHCKDGSYKWILDRGKVIEWAAEGQPLRVIGTHTDISDLKRVEEELRQERNLLSHIMETSPAGIVVLSPEGEITFANARTEQILGLSRNEVIGRTYKAPDWHIQSVDGSSFPEEELPFIRIMRTKEPVFNIEHAIKWPDGQCVQLSINGAPSFNAAGQIDQVVVTIEDITDRKRAEATLQESEERLRLALVAANQGIYDLNIQTGEAIVSPEYAIMLGYDPETFHETNARWIERLHLKDRESVANIYRAYVAGEIPEYKVEFRQRTQTGDWKWILSLGKIVEWDGSGQPLRMLGTHTDIGDLKQAEAALQVRTQQQSVVSQLGQLALAATDLSVLMDTATVLVAESLGVEYCKILERLADGTGLLLRAGVGWQPGLVGQAIMGMDADSQASYTLSIDKPVIVEDLQTDPRFSGSPLLLDHQVISGLSVIIQGGDQPFGVLGAHSTQQQHFTQDDVNFLQAVAHILATAIGRKRNEESLRTSEAELRALFAAMTDVVVVRDTQGRCLKVAPTKASTFYIPPAEMLGKTTHETFSTAEAEMLLNAIQTALATNQTIEIEFSLEIEERVVWFDASVSPMTEDSAVIVARDMSDRKHTELELRQQKELLQTIFDHLPVMVGLYSARGEVLVINQELERVIGWTKAEYQTVDVLRACYPDPVDYEQVLSHIVTADSTWRDFKTQVRDGRILDTSWAQIRLSDDRSLGIGQDITDRKQAEMELQASETRFRYLAANIPGMVYQNQTTLEGEFAVLYASSGCYDLYEVSAEEMMSGRYTFQDFEHSEDRPVIDQMITRASQLLQPFNQEFRIVTLSGTIKWIQAISQPTQQADDSIIWDGIMLDISDRKVTEAALEESQKQYQNLVDNSPDIIERFDLELRHLYVSPVLTSLTGIPGEEFLGKTCRDLGMYESMVKDWESAAIRLLATRQKQVIEFETSTLKGVRSFEMAIVPELSDQQTIESILCISRDISDRKQAEVERLQAEQVRNELKLLENILDIILAGYWDWNIPNDQEYLSPGFKHMFGYADHELPNTPETWQCLIFAEDLPAVMDCFDRHVQSHGEVPFYNEVRYRHKDGSTVWVICSGEVIEWDRDSKPVRMIGCHINITQLKQVEELLRKSDARLKTAQRIGKLGGWEFEVQTGELTWSEEVFRIYGLDPNADPPTYDQLQHYIHPEDWEHFDQTVQAAIASGQSYDLEHRLFQPDGTLVYVLARGEMIYDAIGQLTHIIGTALDITDRKLAEQKIQQTATELAEANRELESFSYSVSHDLRAPLRHINGFVNALQQQLENYHALTDPKVVHYLQVIETSSQKMAQLIDGLLMLSRIGRKTMDYKPVNMRELIDQAIALFGNNPDTIVPVEFVIGELPIVRGDASLLQQVLSNLISNAVKFTRHHPAPRIEIGSLPDGTMVVRDNGIGFQMEYADKLFEAFQRLHAQTEFEGTGIGLAIVKRIIHRHGGTIWVESQPNQGTSFYFTVGSYA